MLTAVITTLEQRKNNLCYSRDKIQQRNTEEKGKECESLST